MSKPEWTYAEEMELAVTMEAPHPGIFLDLLGKNNVTGGNLYTIVESLLNPTAVLLTSIGAGLGRNDLDPNGDARKVRIRSVAAAPYPILTLKGRQRAKNLRESMLNPDLYKASHRSELDLALSPEALLAFTGQANSNPQDLLQNLESAREGLSYRIRLTNTAVNDALRDRLSNIDDIVAHIDLFPSMQGAGLVKVDFEVNSSDELGALCRQCVPALETLADFYGFRVHPNARPGTSKSRFAAAQMSCGERVPLTQVHHENVVQRLKEWDNALRSL